MADGQGAVAPDGGHGIGPGGLPPVVPVGSSQPALARCYRHPQRETGVRCVRCERPICPECMRPASVGFQCPDDVKLGRITQRPVRTVVGAPVRTRRIPYVTATLVALNVLVYLLTALPSPRGINNPASSRLFQSWWLVPQKVALNNEYYRLLTSAFLHDNLVHIAFNMVALAIVGPYLERLLGPVRYTVVYLLAALGGSVAVFVFGERYTPVVGASGAIFGLFAASLLLVRELGYDPRSLIFTIVANFVFTFAVPNISKLGHIGGFVLGGLAVIAIAGLPGNRRRLSAATQTAGLAGLFVVLVVIIAWRGAVL